MREIGTRSARDDGTSSPRRPSPSQDSGHRQQEWSHSGHERKERSPSRDKGHERRERSTSRDRGHERTTQRSSRERGHELGSSQDKGHMRKYRSSSRDRGHRRKERKSSRNKKGEKKDKREKRKRPRDVSSDDELGRDQRRPPPGREELSQHDRSPLGLNRRSERLRAEEGHHEGRIESYPSHHSGGSLPAAALDQTLETLQEPSPSDPWHSGDTSGPVAYTQLLPATLPFLCAIQVRKGQELVQKQGISLKALHCLSIVMAILTVFYSSVSGHNK